MHYGVAGVAYQLDFNTLPSMRIAVLAWGSLIWDKNAKPILRVKNSDWTRGGPVLPIEFSRVSQRGERQGCLTLVIDRDSSIDSPTRFNECEDGDLDSAIENLMGREGCGKNSIGFIDKSGNSHLPQNEIEAWLSTRDDFDAVIWTGLSSNFKKVTGESFSIAGAAAYLEKLDPNIKTKAFQYLNNAPEEVKTPLRIHVMSIGAANS